jgi:hypothetical protein
MGLWISRACLALEGMVTPPGFRDQADITTLNKFTMEEIDTILRHHEG